MVYEYMFLFYCFWFLFDLGGLFVCFVVVVRGSGDGCLHIFFVSCLFAVFCCCLFGFSVCLFYHVLC